uniref:Uncharacterized protein n=1 Tax=Rhizophora mucronata TaxID=61149 RepID=A0A2P2IU68_RHIMU
MHLPHISSNSFYHNHFFPLFVLSTVKLELHAQIKYT